MVSYLEDKAKLIRQEVLKMAVFAGAGHIAPSLSCTDILVALYYGGILKINPKKLKLPSRDRFILSKGHGSMALYAILADLEFFSKSELKKYFKEKGILGVHAENVIPGIEVSTGSLGHGLSLGCGLALGAKMDNKKYLTFILIGDGECHEGSVWEAAMFAAQHKLKNLVAIIDYNRLSATGVLKDYLDIEPLQDKWKSFGWEVKIVNGHCFKDLLKTLKKLRNRPYRKPLVIIASTIKGKGISFMENKPIWHYRIPNDRELKKANRDLG